MYKSERNKELMLLNPTLSWFRDGDRRQLRVRVYFSYQLLRRGRLRIVFGG